jgi:transglutaminase-like putative cysteine protease
MKFKVSGTLGYEVLAPSTLIINIHAISNSAQALLEEVFTIEPCFQSEELIPLQSENRFVRVGITEPGPLTINYNATINTTYKKTAGQLLTDVPVMELDAAVLPYLMPSRYCQSDKLHRFAHNKFGKIKNGFDKVTALTNWIHEHVEYLTGSTNWQTSAYDTVTELAGVCRDFAHLGIALCRALDIPARYFTGYAYLLNPPDFHACFEAYLSGQWVVFDATRLVPLNGLVKIATGRDAADTAIASIFGEVNCLSVYACCDLADEGFQPFENNAGQQYGLTYL